MLKNFCCFETHGTASTTTLKANQESHKNQLINRPLNQKKKFLIEKNKESIENEDASDTLFLTGSENSNYDETAKLCSNTSFDQNVVSIKSVYSSNDSSNNPNNLLHTKSIHFYHPKSIQTRNNTLTSQNLTLITPTPISTTNNITKNKNINNQILSDSLEYSSTSHLTTPTFPTSHKQHFNSILSSFKINIQKYQEQNLKNSKTLGKCSDSNKKQFIDEIYLDQQKLITNMPSITSSSVSESNGKSDKDIKECRNLVDVYESINSANLNLVKLKSKKCDENDQTAKIIKDDKFCQQHVISSVTINNFEEAVANVQETYNTQEIAYMSEHINKVVAEPELVATNKNRKIRHHYENCKTNNRFEKKTKFRHENHSKEKKTTTSKSTQLVILLKEKKEEKDSTISKTIKTTKKGYCNNNAKLADESIHATKTTNSKVARIAKNKLSSTPIFIAQSGSYNITNNDTKKSSSLLNKLSPNQNNNNNSKHNETILSTISNNQIKLNKIKFKNQNQNYNDSILVKNSRKFSLNAKLNDHNHTKPSLNEEKMSQDLEKLLSRLETVTTRLESYAASSSSHGAKVNGVSSNVNGSAVESFDDLPSISGFDNLYNSTFKSFRDLTANIGPDVKTIVDLVDKLFKFERSFLVEAARSLQPSQDVLMKFYQQFSKQIEEVQSYREKNRTSQFFNHLSAISESIGAFGWISVQPAPSPFVKEMSDSAQFYTNRVLKDYKEKDQNHVNWVKLWLQFLNELQAYVKQHHTTGVVWNNSKKGDKFDLNRISVSGSATSTNSVSKAPAPGPAGPPPPPPPPMPDFNQLLAEDNKPASSNGGAITDALFAEINRGSDITKGLRQVTDAQKTHKNPALRGSHTIPGGSLSSSNSVRQQVGASTQVQKPPVLELVDKKWKVEYQLNKNDLVIDQTDLKHTVYIYQCKECTIQVKGKVNSILIDSCTRVALLFDDVLSTIEFINSKNVQMQVLGRVPTVIIEKTDGCQVYLSKQSLETEIISSKSSAMNILTPNRSGDEYTEQPVPEQYKTFVDPKSGKLVTSPTELV